MRTRTHGELTLAIMLMCVVTISTPAAAQDDPPPPAPVDELEDDVPPPPPPPPTDEPAEVPPPAPVEEEEDAAAEERTPPPPPPATAPPRPGQPAAGGPPAEGPRDAVPPAQGEVDDRSEQERQEDQLLAVVGEVIEVEEDGTVVISFGREDGLTVGRMIEFFVMEEDPLDGPGATYRRMLGKGRVEEVGDRRARVVPGINVRIPAEARVRVSEDRWGLGGTTPDRPAGVSSLQINFRPFFPLDYLGLGVLSEAAFTTYLDAPISLGLRLSPLGLAFTSQAGNLVTFAAVAMVAYDSQYFKFGLGAGAASVEAVGGEDLPWGGYVPTEGEDLQPVDRTVTLQISQEVRLGALDGLHGMLINHMAIADERWQWGGLELAAQIPMSAFIQEYDRTWVLVRGGGSPTSGQAYFEAGLRLLLSGSGLEGSFFLTPTIGLGFLLSSAQFTCNPDGMPGNEQPCLASQDISYGGPLLGIGLEWRL